MRYSDKIIALISITAVLLLVIAANLQRESSLLKAAPPTATGAAYAVCFDKNGKIEIHPDSQVLSSHPSQIRIAQATPPTTKLYESLTPEDIADIEQDAINLTPHELRKMKIQLEDLREKSKQLNQSNNLEAGALGLLWTTTKKVGRGGLICLEGFFYYDMITMMNTYKNVVLDPPEDLALYSFLQHIDAIINNKEEPRDLWKTPQGSYRPTSDELIYVGTIGGAIRHITPVLEIATGYTYQDLRIALKELSLKNEIAFDNAISLIRQQKDKPLGRAINKIKQRADNEIQKRLEDKVLEFQADQFQRQQQESIKRIGELRNGLADVLNKISAIRELARAQQKSYTEALRASQEAQKQVDEYLLNNPKAEFYEYAYLYSDSEEKRVQAGLLLKNLEKRLKSLSQEAAGIRLEMKREITQLQSPPTPLP